MYRKVRRKFIVLGVILMILLLSIIVFTSGCLNYIQMKKSADEVLDLIQERVHGQSFNETDNSIDFEEGLSDRTLELIYEARFFVVYYEKGDMDGEVYLEHIVSIDKTEALDMAQKTLNKGKSRGDIGAFRYCVRETASGTSIVFLDCGRAYDLIKSDTLTQLGISLGSSVVVFILLLIYSRKIMYPIVEADKRQKEFISAAGHELKTPLTIIDADSELLRMEIDGDNEWLDDISVQTKRLANLTNDLIQLAKFDELNDNMTRLEFPFSDMVSETVQSFHSVVEYQKRTIQTSVEQDVSYTGDEKSLRQMIGILVDNAIKYSTENSVIRVSLIQKKRELILIVQNETESINEIQISKVFDRFYRAEQPIRSESIGYGLGLPTAKKIVELHDGKISASLHDKNLFEITVRLPVRTSNMFYK